MRIRDFFRAVHVELADPFGLRRDTARMAAEIERSLRAERDNSQTNANARLVTGTYARLVVALEQNFTDTQLYSFIATAEHSDNRGASNWELLRRAAMDAADRAAIRRTDSPEEQK